jgi:hypothetical protein
MEADKPKPSGTIVIDVFIAVIVTAAAAGLAWWFFGR